MVDGCDKGGVGRMGVKGWCCRKGVKDGVVRWDGNGWCLVGRMGVEGWSVVECSNECEGLVLV